MLFTRFCTSRFVHCLADSTQIIEMIANRKFLLKVATILSPGCAARKSKENTNPEKSTASFMGPGKLVSRIRISASNEGADESDEGGSNELLRSGVTGSVC